MLPRLNSAATLIQRRTTEEDRFLEGMELCDHGAGNWRYCSCQSVVSVSPCST